MTTGILPSPFRILIVENDPLQRENLVDIVQGWQFEVYAAGVPEKARGTHEALLEDARHKAHAHRCHLAILDMRLQDDNDPADTSGLTLVRDLAPTVSIIRSGWGDMRTVRAALKPVFDPPLRAYDFVGKEDGPVALKKVIEDAAKEIWKQREMEILWPHDLDPVTLIERCLSREDAAFYDEVDNVLRRLFPTARYLKIRPLDEKYTASSLTLRPRSLMLLVQMDDHNMPYLVKIGRALTIEREASNFRKINSCVGYPLTLRSDPIVLWNLGGICYELVGTVSPFSDYYVTHELSDVRRILGELAQSWQRLYHSDCERLNQPDDTVFEAYSKVYNWVLGTDWPRLMLETGRCRTSDFPEPYLRLNLPDSISWVIQQLKLTSSGKHAADRTPKTGVAMTHGDLHSDNILVTDRDEVHFIGFDRTGYGPVLRDYVELEADILTRLTPLTVEWAELWDLYLAVVTPLDSGKTPKMDATERLLRHPETRKAFFTIKELRLQALRSVGYFDQDAYLWSMLLEIVLSQLTMIREHLNQDVVFSRLRLLGSIICSRLDSWNRRWPPTEWHHAAAALPEIKWVSEADQKAQANYVAYLQGRMKDVIAEIEQARKEQRNPRDLLEKKLQIEEQLRAFGEEL